MSNIYWDLIKENERKMNEKIKEIYNKILTLENVCEEQKSEKENEIYCLFSNPVYFREPDEYYLKTFSEICEDDFKINKIIGVVISNREMDISDKYIKENSVDAQNTKNLDKIIEKYQLTLCKY